jgi:tetratricopeptide (TPR) repeat protein
MDTTAKEIAARAFLKSGVLGNISEAELARLCDLEIQKAARRSFRRASKIATRFVAISEPYGAILRSTAYRAVARISHLSGNHAHARDAYVKARRLVRGDPMIRARIDRALIDVYMYLGEHAVARRAARRAIRVFSDLKAAGDLAKTKVNYANLLHRQDRHREAEVMYHEAAHHFERSGDELSVAKCYFNRANTLVQLFDLDTAEALYDRAVEIYTKAEYFLDACDSRYGLAWLRMLTGRFHAALRELSACEKIYAESGDRRGAALCILDRAEVYLSLGLYQDALCAARESERKFRQLRLIYESAKAALFRGQAAHALNKIGEAVAARKRAAEYFSAEGNDGFLGVVHLLAADLCVADRLQHRKETACARRHFKRAQLPLWEAVSDLCEAADPGRIKSALARLSANAAARHVPQIFAAWKTVEGDYEIRRGRRSDARQCWKKAADRLDAVRAQLPPLEIRSRFGKNGHSPHVRLIQAELDRDPRAAAAWSERFKTAGIWAPISFDRSSDPARRAVGDSLDALARRISALARQVGMHYGRRGDSHAAARQALTKLQRRIRDEMLAVERSEGIADNGFAHEKIMESFRQVSQRLPIIQFHVGEDDIIAFVHRGADTSMHRFFDGRNRLAEFMKRWRFVLEGVMLADYLGRSDLSHAERVLWEELGEWLWRPLELDRSQKSILVLPEGELANLPWPATVVDGQPLIERHQFVVAPSLRHHLAAESVRSCSKEVVIFKGITDGLPETDKEVESLRRMAGAHAAVFDPCRREDWPETGDAAIWHYAGHAELLAANPFYSFLNLANGPIFAADFRLKRCRVNLVTLAGCRSGEQIALPGEECTGLVRSLLEMGAGTVVAGLWPVSDHSSRLWMESFYGRLFQGEAISDAAGHASRTVRRKHSSAYHWAAFSVYGASGKGVTK